MKYQSRKGEWSVQAKGEWACRNCHKSRAVHLHHAIPAGLGGKRYTDLRGGLPLCEPCHSAWHAGERNISRYVFARAEWAFLLTVKTTWANTEDWLLDHYPVEPSAAEGRSLTDREEGKGEGVVRSPTLRVGGAQFVPESPEDYPENGEWIANAPPCPHPTLEEGEKCSCGYRKPHAKKADSPKTSTAISFKCPQDVHAEFLEIEQAVFEHMGLVHDGKAEPFARHKAVLTGYAAVLGLEPGERVA